MPDPTFNNADTNDADLGNFFSRPVKIQSFSWATGNILFEKFNPWQDFFENPRVLARITNFNLLRCKLKVRIMLNGNSFHYGRAIASYLPLHNLDEFTTDRGFFIQDVVAASQRPHVFLDPTTSQGGTLTLPFVWYENAVNIPLQEWRELGNITIHGMQDLKHANGATDEVIVSVFAWAEEVSLSIPTANEPGVFSSQALWSERLLSNSPPDRFHFEAQATGDEYGSGPISRPAGILAQTAGTLSNVPGIGMYARATALAASAVSNVATMFGYSRPVELADITPYKPTLLGNMANTNVPDTSQKLSLDAKQELTIDPRVMGLGSTDEMTILSIAQRESFLTQFGWAVSDSAETLLWNSEVSPVLWNALSGTETEIHMPACCFAALPFRRWRGTMKFRFQIVASAFHKGRLKVVYDPSYPLTNEYNTNYTYIVDLAKERDFTVEVGWGHEKSLLNHRDPTTDAKPYKTTMLGSEPGNYGNGIISVYVVNDLTVPNSTANNDIEVNVFVSAGDDFEVFDPDSKNIEALVWFQPQAVPATRTIFEAQASETTSDIVNHPDADLTKKEDEPMKEEPSATLAPTVSSQDHTSFVYYGDPVVSFRQCLKRYNYHSAICPQSSIASAKLLRARLGDFPYYRGYAPGAVHATESSVAYNYSKMTLLNYVTPAFACRRGGLRWKYLRTSCNANDTSFMMVVRDASSESKYLQSETAAYGVGDRTHFSRVSQYSTLLPHTWDGAVGTSTRQNPVIEAEMPFTTNVRFFPAKQANQTTPVGFINFHWLTTIWSAADTEPAAIHAYVSVGEDFTLGFFTGAPIAWYVARSADPPAL